MFTITDLDMFSEKIKLFVFEKFKFGLAEMNNTTSKTLHPDDFITNEESKLIISEILYKENEGNWQEVPDDLSVKFCESINTRIYSNALAKMVREGKLDCAFSSENDSFEFCVTEEGQKLGVKIFPRDFLDDF